MCGLINGFRRTQNNVDQRPRATNSVTLTLLDAAFKLQIITDYFLFNPWLHHLSLSLNPLTLRLVSENYNLYQTSEMVIS